MPFLPGQKKQCAVLAWKKKKWCMFVWEMKVLMICCVSQPKKTENKQIRNKTLFFLLSCITNYLLPPVKWVSTSPLLWFSSLAHHVVIPFLSQIQVWVPTTTHIQWQVKSGQCWPLPHCGLEVHELGGSKDAKTQIILFQQLEKRKTDIYSHDDTELGILGKPNR